ncbi:MAG: hypothetical protein AMXMBFR74_31520 [Parvibaculum sp.]|uniref:hypothetical protein n=1 Tax=Parvibaculum sp. TaxID=2024848 RepID=UPI0035B7FDA1
MIEQVITALGVLFSLLAAGFWFCASVLDVPDNIDTFIDALRKISRMNAFGALSAALAALCAAGSFYFDLLL